MSTILTDIAPADTMPTNLTPAGSEIPQSIYWAYGLGFNTFEMHWSKPWSTIWTCRQDESTGSGDGNKGGGAYLKEQHRPSVPSIAALGGLSSLGHAAVPRVLHTSETHKCYLQEEVVSDFKQEDEQKHYATTLAAYADLQNLYQKHSSTIPVFNPLGYMEILDRTSGLIENDTDDMPSNPFADMDPALRQKGRDSFARSYDVLARLTEDLAGVPKTVNHTDLHPGNTRYTTDRALRIIDWDDAIFSAPGWSLYKAFGTPARVYAALNKPSLYKIKTVAHRDQILMRAYLKTLTAGGIYDKQDLKKILPITATMGSLKFLGDIGPYDGVDSQASRYFQLIAVKTINDVAIFLGLLPKSTKPRPLGRSRSNMNTMTSFPTLNYSEGDYQIEDQALSAQAAQSFNENGALLIRNCYRPSMVKLLYQEFAKSGPEIAADIAGGQAMQVGGKRYMLSLPAEGTAGRPDFLANNRMCGILERLLGKDYILGSMTVVLSLDGSPAQQWHRDNSTLFPDSPTEHTPPFCVSAIIPLIPLDETNGPTEVIPGSHLTADKDINYDAPVHATMDFGDCYLMDSRLMHRGMPNNSRAARPILCLVYQRPWFRDYQNFNGQSAVTISKEALSTFPENRQHLLNWAAK